MHYVTYSPVTEPEQELFKKCSFKQPLMSHLSPLWALDKPLPGLKSTYSNMTHWLQQSKSHIDHFWNEDTALVKALRQYHFTSNMLEGHTQWKFQKSRILHHILDMIALHMEDSRRCLDYCGFMPVDQTFRCHDPNLHHLKAAALKEVAHLTMIIILDEDHTHYSDAFGNMFKEDTLRKKQFPDGPDGITMSKGGAAHVIVCCFCPYACSNDDYVYCHLAATHLNIQWGCGVCFEFVNGYVSKICEHVLSHQKSSKEQS